MTDLEYLGLSAKAAGIAVEFRETNTGIVCKLKDNWGPNNRWNPLDDDGDALRLAVKMGFINPGCWPDCSSLVLQGYSWEEATRRAIVYAAAARMVRSIPEILEEIIKTFEHISDPKNAHLFSADAARKAFAHIPISCQCFDETSKKYCKDKGNCSRIDAQGN